MRKTVAFGSDHAGLDLKESLKQGAEASGWSTVDLGTNSREPCDYPDFAQAVVQCLREGKAERGLLVCGTGVGMALAANRHAGIRAVNCSDVYTAKLSRQHNDSNVLALGARVVGPGLAEAILQVWLATEFASDERHLRRLRKADPGS